jgi:hypothetical protein
MPMRDPPRRPFEHERASEHGIGDERIDHRHRMEDMKDPLVDRGAGA